MAAAPPKNGPGPKPELRWIKLSQLYIPRAYQRSVKSDASAKLRVRPVIEDCIRDIERGQQ